MITKRFTAIGLGLCALTACGDPPRATGPAPLTANEAGTPAPPTATAAPAPAATAPKGGCLVEKDCRAGEVCVFEKPGCESPAGRCAPPELLACAAAFPVVTCDGAPYATCLSLKPQVPWFSRVTGEEAFPFPAGKRTLDVYGQVGQAVVLHVDDDVMTDTALRAAALEQRAHATRATRDPELVSQAVDIYRGLAGKAAPQGGDARWELVLLDRKGARLTSVAFDKFGRTGEVAGQGASFAHPGALVALKVLAAKMPPADGFKLPPSP
jgi:hypothetical protein